MFALEFPPINEVIRWRDLFPSFNKVGLIACLAVLIGSTIYIIAARRDPMVAPKGVRNIAEVGVEFIEDQIVMQTLGREGLGWTPFLLTLFIFVYLCNLPEVLPDDQKEFPATEIHAIAYYLFRESRDLLQGKDTSLRLLQDREKDLKDKARRGLASDQEKRQRTRETQGSNASRD